MAQLDLVFAALSDPTRRAILAQLAQGAVAVSDLARPTGLRLPTVMRHLEVLEEAGLISSAKDGRVRSCALVPQALMPVRNWLEEQRVLWEARLDRLEDYVMQLMKDQDNDR
jgi:DNA-binding transcriptional ArsR family regulator